MSCSVDIEEDVAEPELNATPNLELRYSDRFIVVLSEKPAAQSEQAGEILDNLESNLGIPERAVVYKYRKIFSGFTAKLSQKKADALKNNPNVEYVVRDIQVENFSFESAQQDFPVWGLDRIDQRDNLLNQVYSYNSTGKGVTVYIMDTGINFSHEEFEGRASLGYDFVQNDAWFEKDPNQAPGEDCHGHGTHVAATVGGKNYGVAKDVNLVSVRVFGCKNGTLNSVVLAAVEWITENGQKPAVVNMSLGGYYSVEMDPIETAIKNSIQTGITYVIAAGNSGSDACEISPARVQQAITVAASDINNEMAGFSSYGNCVDLFAPGVGILSASHLDNNSARHMSGTSMAAPHVAGIASLFIETNLQSTPNQIHEAIVTNSTENVVMNVPEGTNNLAYSLWQETIITEPALVLEVLAYKDKGSVRAALTWNTPGDFSAGLVRVFIDGKYVTETHNDGLWFYNTGGKIPASFQICPVNFNICSASVSPVIVDDPILLPNQEPIARFGYLSNGLEFSFTDYSRDDDGEIVGWEWSLGDGTTSNLQNPTHIYSAEGYYLVTLRVTDDRGGSSTFRRNILAEEPVEPEPVNLQLSVETTKSKGRTYAHLSWTPSGTSELVQVYMDNSLKITIPNDGSESIDIGRGGGSAIIKICIPDSSYCSNEVIVEF
ncbi:S8 family serine peptidase [Gramella jeungdoensis]|uniref:S8 family serine peptidase n=1 Tax=Gramella jeungdoensis TaxID=708091 RepID=A0ABT0Z3X3_9FLAO|nr:S8 family serine peptidase [Gramella jeungdoensis]MCM8570437.1 S8 family serine peptidase [Gramella jeungdoensis]